MREANRHPLGRLADVRDHRRRQLDLGDAVEVEASRRVQPGDQVGDRRGVADRIGFKREAVSRRHPRREAQRRHRDVLNAARAVIDELEPGLS